MNTYEKKTVVVTPKAELLTALDEATAKRLPDDIIFYVIGDLMEDLVETRVEQVQTFKLQPRQPLKELKNYARHHAGGCGVCVVNTSTCVCTTPPLILNFAARFITAAIVCPCMIGSCVTELSCDLCCERQNVCDLGNPSPCTHFCLNDCLGDYMPCARKDYRLNRSCCWDCMSLANDCCCCSSALLDEADYKYTRARNGPEAMFMD